MSSLTRLVSPGGEVVQAITARDLIEAAGITDIREADDEQLAAFTDNAKHLTSLAREAAGIVSDELVQRMDRKGRWTLHLGEFTARSSSPTAGTTAYDSDALAVALDELCDEGLIDREGAEAALEWVVPSPPEPYWKQKAAGISALLKLGGRVAEAIEGARVPVEPPKRTVKVTRKRGS